MFKIKKYRNIQRSSSKLYVLLIIITIFITPGFSQIYPVTVSLSAGGAPSSYLTDYANPDLKGINCSVLFNDLNEPYWNVYLSISMHSSNITIETAHNFRPNKPISLSPGVPYLLTAADLLPYFDFEKLNISGLSKAELQRTGRIPDGFYQFVIKVYDFQSGKLLSNEGSLWLQIQLSDPPILIQPSQARVIIPDGVQNIGFEWTLPNLANSGNEFIFCIYQLQPPYTDPSAEIIENKAFKLFESNRLQLNQFIYTQEFPLLQKGRAYAWRVQVKNSNEQSQYKNEGWSPVSMFYYGYPTEGKIELFEPADYHNFQFREDKYFKWGPPDNLTKNQVFHYKLNIYEKHTGQNEQQAINNQPWFTFSTPEFSSLPFGDALLDNRPKPNQEYIWQVKAYSLDEQIAESQLNHFIGPPLLEYFRAGNQRLKVLRLDSSDPANLSGKALVKINEDGSTLEVQFSNLKLINVGGEYKLQEGEIKAAVHKTIVHLTPENKLNGDATLNCDSLLLSQDKFDLKCQIKCPFPHATLPGTMNEVISKSGWLSYEDFRVVGELPISNDSLYHLIDPLGFNIGFVAGSYFIVRGKNQYILNLNGKVNCSSGERKQPIQFCFYATDQFYTMNLTATNSTEIEFIDDERLCLKPFNGILDLSEISTPDLYNLLPAWKGIIVDNYELSIKNKNGTTSQLRLNDELHFAVHPDSAIINPFLINRSGVLLNFKVSFTNPLKAHFNSFPAMLHGLKLQLDRGEITNGKLDGSIIIPAISRIQKFPFIIPINRIGLQDGYLNNDLIDFNWIFNSGNPEELVEIKINRAIFENNDHLKLDINMSWPSISIKQLTLNALCIWANGNFGFNIPDGIFELESPVVGEIESYPFELIRIGAGYSNGFYAIGASGNIETGEGVSGVNGPPVVNVYSIIKEGDDSLAVIDYEHFLENITDKETADIIYKVPDGDTTTGNLIANQELKQYNQNYDSIIELLNQDRYAIYNRVDSKINADLLKDTVPGNSNYFNVSFESSLTSRSLKNSLNNITPQDIIELIDFLSPGMPQYEASQLQKIKEFISGLSGRQLCIIYIQLTDIQKLIKAKLDNIISSAADKIKITIDTINAFFRREVHGFSNGINNGICRQLSYFFTQLREEIIQNLSILSAEDLQLLESCIRSVSDEIVANFSLSFNNAIDKNLITYFTDSITYKIYKRIEYAVHNELCKSAIESIKEGKIEISLKPLLTNIQNDLKKQIDFNNINKVIQKTASQIFAGLNLKNCYDKVLDNFSEALLQKLNILKDKVNGKLDQLKEKYLSKIDGTPELSETNIGVGISLNFKNLGEKLKNKDLKGLVKLDPICISGSFKFLKYKGMLDLCKDDPVYGNVWKGEIEMAMTSPLPFSISATYISGKKNDFNYWMIQIEPKEENSKSNAKSSKRPKVLKSPVNLGFVKLMAVSGRVFHHMGETSGRLIPNIKINYGAYLGFIVFDGTGNGNLLRAELDADFQINENEDYDLSLKGNLQTGSKVYSILIPDPKPLVSATLELCYNSAAKHFIGKGIAEINKPSVLCATGMIYVDISPGRWNLMIGSREERINFVPGCKGWSPTGWLAINQSKAELGLGIQFSFTTSQSINLKFAELGILIDAGFAAGIEAVISYNPFAIDELGIWADIWALVAIKYALHIPWEKHGTINLIDIYCKGDLIMRFRPVPTTLLGDVRGHFRILGVIGCNFKGHFEKQIS
jgi:hypothetical protein